MQLRTRGAAIDDASDFDEPKMRMIEKISNAAGPRRRLFGHIEVAPIFTFSSGRPVNVLTGTDEERSRAYPFASRPLGIRRNTLRTSQFVNVDLRIVKYIPYGEWRRLDFVTEAFNLYNHPNVLSLNPFYGSGMMPQRSFGYSISHFVVLRPKD